MHLDDDMSTPSKKVSARTTTAKAGKVAKAAKSTDRRAPSRAGQLLDPVLTAVRKRVPPFWGAIMCCPMTSRH